jgi:Predicted nucleotide-binding protein containing TIR-like domain
MKALPKAPKLSVGHTGTHLARIDQPAVRRVVAEQQRTDAMPAALRIAPPDDDELLAVEALRLQPCAPTGQNKGRALITKFREEAAGVGFAVVLMTPDDLGKAEKAVDLNARARQNVVFELGFFIGRVGPERVAALVKGDIELPSDYDGVVYISLDNEDWQTKLGVELQAAGFEFDWNKVMRR